MRAQSRKINGYFLHLKGARHPVPNFEIQFKVPVIKCYGVIHPLVFICAQVEYLKRGIRVLHSQQILQFDTILNFQVNIIPLGSVSKHTGSRPGC